MHQTSGTRNRNSKPQRMWSAGIRYQC